MNANTIVEVSIQGLYGLYSHTVPLSAQGITILHGANGIGKTAFLKCIKSFIENDFDFLDTMPFEKMTISTRDGASYVIEKNKGLEKKNNLSRKTYKIQIQKDGKKTKTENINIDSKLIRLANLIAESNNNYEKISDHYWLDKEIGRILTIPEIIDENTKIMSSQPSFQLWSLDKQILGNRKVIMIDANRLNQAKASNKNSSSSIDYCSSDLKEKIKNSIAEYGKISQSLDQSFPSRLISGHFEVFEKVELQNKLQKIQKLNSEFSTFGLLNQNMGPELPSNIRDISDDKIEAISLFVQDSLDKMQSIEEIAEKCKIFTKIFKEKFKNKTVLIDRDRGIHIVTDDGKTLGLNMLSSGEQHQVVMFYELLFKTTKDTLVLIDEPELSLHLNWQKKFITDLIMVSRVNGFESIIATHSPFIVGDNHELLRELGGE